jgi:hypothetical protein
MCKKKGGIYPDYIESYLDEKKGIIYFILGEHDEHGHYDLIGNYTFMGELIRWIHCLKSLNLLTLKSAEVSAKL